MDVRVSTRTTGLGVVITLAGTLDLAALPVVHDALRRAHATGTDGTMFVDLDGAGAVDDTVLGLLLGAAAEARSSHGRLVVVSSDERVRSRLRDRRVDRVIDVAASISDHLARPERSSAPVDDR